MEPNQDQINQQNQPPIPSAAPDVSNSPPITAPQTALAPKNLLPKVRPLLAGLFQKFYSNKKVFWPVAAAFSLILFVIIIGLLFGKRNAQTPTVKLPTPSPIIQSTPMATSSGNILIDSQNKLNDLKNQINNLDVSESRLQPPTLNFDIKF